MMEEKGRKEREEGEDAETELHTQSVYILSTPLSPRMLIRVAEALVNNLFRFLLVYVPSGNIDDFF